MKNKTVAQLLFIGLPIIPGFIFGLLGALLMALSGVIAYKIFSSTTMSQTKKIVLIVLTYLVGSIVTVGLACVLSILLTAAALGSSPTPSALAIP